jgi:hypothetical protein
MKTQHPKYLAAANANAALRVYCEKLAPDAIIDAEFGRRLGDKDLVDYLIEHEVELSAHPALADLYPTGPITLEQARLNWDAKSDIEKRMDQVSFVDQTQCYF